MIIGHIDTKALPRFRHDCEKCVFVGHGYDGRIFDAYVCPGDQCSLIRRRSDRAEDYGSFPLFVGKSIDVYLEVLKAAAWNIERFDEEGRRTILKPLVDENLWTLQEYIDWLNRPEEGVWKGELMPAEDWAEYNITTASQLGDHLDAEFEKEVRKSQY